MLLFQGAFKEEHSKRSIQRGACKEKHLQRSITTGLL
jgi:hypothetical protein